MRVRYDRFITIGRLVNMAWLLLGLCMPVVVQSESTDTLRAQSKALFGTLARVTQEELNRPAVVLGQRLFWDMRLSRDGQTACASCHFREAYGADTRVQSTDARGKLTRFHSMTIFNTQQARAGLRWLADRDSGAAQAIGSVTGSMGFDERTELLPLLQEYGYAPAFEAAFPESGKAVSIEHYGAALEAYQRSLRTPAPFDRWLDGDDEALSERELAGLERFVKLGCAGCHNGPLLGGGALQRFGVVSDYGSRTGSREPDDGLMRVTGKEEDRYVFRVQPLRNVAKTAPYFHDGSVKGLKEAIDIMADVQLGQDLSDEAVAELAVFLKALTGSMPEHFGAPESVPLSVSHSGS